MNKTYLIALMMLATPLAFSGEIVGKVQSMSSKGKVIQYLNPKTKEVNVLRFTDDTTLESAQSFSDLTVNTKFKATVNDDNIATHIKRILVKLPPEQVIDTDELSDLIDSGESRLFIGDARPVSVYNVGHLPNAQPTPATELAKNLDWLPKDKATMLVFYCGGVTCPLSPKALKIAQDNGYNNVKAYVEGYPAWKAEMYPSYVSANWLQGNLDIHNVILDVRETAKVGVKGSVHFPTSALFDMHEKWNAEKFPVGKRTIFNIRDRKAPITIVSTQPDDDEAIEAYEILTAWKFKNVSILEGGLLAWQQQDKPQQDVALQLTYVKKPKAGALYENDFIAAVKSNSATIIDVRDSDEVAQGKLKLSINIPLEDLEQHLDQIPKDGQVILHCAAGARAALAYTTLTKLGYTNVTYLDDNFSAIVKAAGISLI